MIAVGIDQAEHSGWAIGDSSTGTIGAYGMARTAAERTAVLQRAAFANGGTLKGVVFMFEDHGKIPLVMLARHGRRPGQPTSSTGSVISLGVPLGRWYEQLDQHHHPRAGRMKVDPRTWRARLGIVAKGSDALKLAARQYASKMLSLDHVIDDDDIAEGICLCMYAILDATVLDSLKKAHLRATKKEARELASQGALFPADAHKLFNTGAK